MADLDKRFVRQQARAAAFMARPLPAEGERPPSLDESRRMLRAKIIQDDATLTAEEKAAQIAALQPPK